MRNRKPEPNCDASSIAKWRFIYLLIHLVNFMVVHIVYVTIKRNRVEKEKKQKIYRSKSFGMNVVNSIISKINFTLTRMVSYK